MLNYDKLLDYIEDRKAALLNEAAVRHLLKDRFAARRAARIKAARGLGTRLANGLGNTLIAAGTRLKAALPTYSTSETVPTDQYEMIDGALNAWTK